jgi:hypothetical protein
MSIAKQVKSRLPKKLIKANVRINYSAKLYDNNGSNPLFIRV